MNKKLSKIVLSLLMLCFSLTLKSQYYTEGNWYTFSKNYISRVNIYPDSIVTHALNFDLTERPNPRPSEALLIVSTTLANGNVYLCLKTKTDTANQRMLSILKPFDSKEKFMLAVNTLDDRFTDLKLMNDYIKNDKEAKYGFTYYSEETIAEMRKLPSVDSMSKESFVKICNDYLAMKEKVDKIGLEPNAPKGLRSYLATSIRNIIYLNGFNPLVGNDTFDQFFKRFIEDPSLKEIIQKVKG